jgi:hypothetical protein
MDNIWFNDDYYYHYTNTYAFDMFERPGALFAPPHDERAVDLDADVLWDYLIIEVKVNVTVEGDYSVTGVMTDDWGWTYIDTVTNSTHLEVGEWTVELLYLGYVIRMSGQDGDYNIELTIRSGAAELDMDNYLTKGSYWDTSFETIPGSFTPPHNAGTLDQNGDGFFDYLIVNASVTVTMAGTYMIYAGLRDSWWDVFEEQTNATYLDVGTTVVELRFTGWVVRYNGVNAPFTVLLELSDSGSRLLDTDSFMTPAYLYTQFQNLPATLNPPHATSGEDTDADGLYENMLVNVSVNVVTAGTFIVQGYLYDSGWDTICMNGTVAALPSGISDVQLRFPAFMIFTNMDNGTYHIYVELQDQNGYELDYDYIVTAFTYYDTFDPGVPGIDSIWADITPTIDGIIGATEWSNAAVVDLRTAIPANGVAGSLLVMNDGANLYIAYDVYGDTSEDSGDYCSVGFDTWNDNLLTDEKEDQFYLSGSTWDPSYHFIYESSGSYWTTHCSPFDDSYADHAGLWGATGFGASIRWTTGLTSYRFRSLS